MESIIQWNRGKSIENILRKIYAKYIYKGNQNSDELEILYSNILELITSENDIQEVESIIANLLSEGKIDEKEYNYLLNAINDKRKEI